VCGQRRAASRAPWWINGVTTSIDTLSILWVFLVVVTSSSCYSLYDDGDDGDNDDDDGDDVSCPPDSPSQLSAP